MFVHQGFFIWQYLFSSSLSCPISKPHWLSFSVNILRCSVFNFHCLPLCRGDLANFPAGITKFHLLLLNLICPLCEYVCAHFFSLPSAQWQRDAAMRQIVLVSPVSRAELVTLTRMTLLSSVASGLWGTTAQCPDLWSLGRGRRRCSEDGSYGTTLKLGN